jgi:hypothetical protein
MSSCEFSWIECKTEIVNESLEMSKVSESELKNSKLEKIEFSKLEDSTQSSSIAWNSTLESVFSIVSWKFSKPQKEKIEIMENRQIRLLRRGSIVASYIILNCFKTVNKNSND